MTADGTALTTAERPFLTARWKHLVLVNYAVESQRLLPHLPPGLSLDLLDGQAHEFGRIRFLGHAGVRISVSGFRNFPEINLRFYVRDGDRRGVCFIREYVPSRLIAWVARSLYNEPYRRAPMTSSVHKTDETLSVSHHLKVGGRTHSLHVEASPQGSLPAEDSEAHFFKEHSWGYGTDRRGNCLRYEVRHPVWETHSVTTMALDWDWGLVYGNEWADFNDIQPRSILLAQGSSISVSPKND